MQRFLLFLLYFRYLTRIKSVFFFQRCVSRWAVNTEHIKKSIKIVKCTLNWAFTAANVLYIKTKTIVYDANPKSINKSPVFFVFSRSPSIARYAFEWRIFNCNCFFLKLLLPCIRSATLDWNLIFVLSCITWWWLNR